jgi:hypothetical protein
VFTHRRNHTVQYTYEQRLYVLMLYGLETHIPKPSAAAISLPTEL